MVSATSMASCWSWVTKMLVKCSSSCSRPQPAPQFMAHLAVQRPEGFVQQEHIGIDGQRTGERDALSLAPGQLCGDSDRPDQPSCTSSSSDCTFLAMSRGRGPLAARLYLEAEGDVLEHRHVAEQGHSAETRIRPLRSRIGHSVASRPSNRTWPLSGVSRPAMMRSSVVLPQPEGPRSAISAPVGTSRSMLSDRGEFAELLADAA